MSSAPTSTVTTTAWTGTQDWTAWLLGIAVVLVTAVFLLYPLGNAMLLAFAKNGEAPGWSTLTLANFSRFFTAASYQKALWNSVYSGVAATLLVAAVSLETGLPVAVVRKEAKAYGTMERIEGHAPAGARAVLIEDVSTTGHQVLEAAKVLEVAGVIVTRIVLAIDRGGADHLREAGYDVVAVAVLRPAT